MRKHECVITHLLPPSLFPLNTIWELEVRALTPQELLSTVATRCEVVVSYVRHRPLRELLKRGVRPEKLVWVAAGSYGPGLLKPNTLLFIVGFKDRAHSQLHILEVKMKKRGPPPAL